MLSAKDLDDFTKKLKSVGPTKILLKCSENFSIRPLYLGENARSKFAVNNQLLNSLTKAWSSENEGIITS
jgi:hypothetical protein